MRTKVINIGNSKGIRIPKLLLEQAQLTEEVILEVKEEGILITQASNMTVSEYRDKFIQLSRYATEEVADDERKQEQFMEGLIGPLQYKPVSHTFPSFRRHLDKAIAVEHKCVQLGKMKRKAITQG